MFPVLVLATVSVHLKLMIMFSGCGRMFLNNIFEMDKSIG